MRKNVYAWCQFLSILFNQIKLKMFLIVTHWIKAFQYQHWKKQRNIQNPYSSYCVYFTNKLNSSKQTLKKSCWFIFILSHIINKLPAKGVPKAQPNPTADPTIKLCIFNTESVLILWKNLNLDRLKLTKPPKCKQGPTFPTANPLKIIGL